MLLASGFFFKISAVTPSFTIAAICRLTYLLQPFLFSLESPGLLLGLDQPVSPFSCAFWLLLLSDV